MSISLNGKTLSTTNYVYCLILYPRSFTGDKIQMGITSLFKSFLDFFTVRKLKSAVIGLIVHGEFKNNGVVSYWIKNKFRTLIFEDLTEHQVQTIIKQCNKYEVKYYENINSKTKELECLIIGPFWTNKLAMLSDIIKNRILETI